MPKFILNELCIGFFWLVILLVFILIGYYNWRQTDKAYKYNPWLALGISLILSCILGGVIYFANGAATLERKAANHLPLYKEMAMKKCAFSQNQNENLLIGWVEAEIQDEHFEFRDCAKQQWQVLINELELSDLEHVKVKNRLKLIGEKQDSFQFQAEEVIPWHGSAVKHKAGGKLLNERKPKLWTY